MTTMDQEITTMIKFASVSRSRSAEICPITPSAKM